MTQVQGRLARKDVPLLTPEEFARVLGYDQVNGQWQKVNTEGAVLIGTDLLVAFAPGGKLAAALGDTIMEAVNAMAALPLFALKVLLRDYHPDGPDLSHCSYVGCYKAWENETKMQLLTVPVLDAMGATDQEVLTPAAIKAGITVAKIRQGLIATSSDPKGQVLAVWPDQHAGQRSIDSHIHALVNKSLWDLVFPKGWKYPYWEEYGGFWASVGRVLGDNGLYDTIQKMAKMVRFMLKRGQITKVTVAVNMGLVTEYCVFTTSSQAQETGMTVVNVLDAIAPFDPDAEEFTLYKMHEAGQLFVTSEVARQTSVMLGLAA